MDLTPKRFDVRLSDDLSKLAGGVSVLTCRYLGKKQQGKIDQDQYTQQRGDRTSIGEDWIERMRKADPGTIKEREEALKKKKHDDPVEWALTQWPEDLVCKHAIKAIDGAPVSVEEVEEWIGDGLHQSVTRDIAVTVLRESGLVPETEQESGEDSDASSRA